MKKRKGFTLIELLAVIVILALISLIAIPLIMNVIESSRKGAYTESLRNLIKAVEYYEAREEIEGNTINFEEGVSVFDSNIEMKNKNFLSGTIKKNEQGELYLDMVSDGVYCGMGTIDKLNVTKGSCGDLDTIVPNNIVITENKVTSNSITIAVSVITGHSGVKYYEYSVDGGSTYTSVDKDSYTFTGLTKDTEYQIKVRITAGNNLTGESEIVTIRTMDVNAPTYEIEPKGDVWAKGKTVTITYPERQEGYIYDYSLDKGLTWIEVREGVRKELIFDVNGTVIARVSDGTNVITGETLVVNKIDKESPNIETLEVTAKDTYQGLNVNVLIEAMDNSNDTLEMNISNTGYEEGIWEAYTGTKNWTLVGSLDGKERVIYVSIKDQAGNKSEKTVTYIPYLECSEVTDKNYSAWGSCSTVCGGGTQSRTGEKVDNHTNKVCGRATTGLTQACNTNACLTPASLKTRGGGIVNENGTYYYKGALSSVNNVIRFNNETWRIISIGSDNNIKIINSVVGQNAWDDEGDATDFSNATINTYLNTTYYNSIGALDRTYINKHAWNIGDVAMIQDDVSLTLEEIQTLEKKKIWTGNIGLFNVSDYVLVTPNASCRQKPIFNYDCRDQNWIYESGTWHWTINVNSKGAVWYATGHNYGDLNGWKQAQTVAVKVRPTLYLNSNIKLWGEGTTSNPYIIVP